MIEKKRIAIVRIAGKASLKKGIKFAFNMIQLYKKNNCVIVPNTKSYLGVMKKLKDYITWGELNEETCKLLLQKRGRLPGKKPLTEEYIKNKLNLTFDQFVKEFMEFKRELRDIPGIKLFFRLKPPTHGFERKGTKIHFSLGGALGYRKDQINELIKRMI